MSKSALVLCVLFMGGGASVAQAQEPVTLTTTADFQRGNNEGLISTAQDRVTRDRITAGTVGGWSSSTALPSSRTRLAAVACNGFVYAVGGDTGPGNPGIPRDRNDVLVAPLNADGSVGSWSATTPFQTGRNAHQCVAYNGFLYVTGGIRYAQPPLNDVQVARINADGTVGSWSATTALPSGRAFHGSLAHNGFLYVIGGTNGAGGVLVAPINADGSVGAWSPTTALPSSQGGDACEAYNGFVYVVGNGQGAVRVAPINADGTFGNWSTTTALPSARTAHTTLVDRGFLYAIGGDVPGVGPVSDVLTAPIQADGTVGAWSATTSLPSIRPNHASVTYGGFVYVIGADVLKAPIDADAGNDNQAPGRLRGAYSHVVDLQSDTSTRFIIVDGQLSQGGAAHLQVRVAPEAGKIFGAETVVTSISLGSAIEVPGTGRYVWIRLTLDDTGTSDADQPTYASNITISPFGPPSAGIVNDGPGEDVDTQEKTTAIDANWSGFTAAAGDSIDFYEWAIGTAPGLTDVQGWVNVGPETSASNSSLSLGAKVNFVSVRATSSAGMASSVATSDGVQVVPKTTAPALPGIEGDRYANCGSGMSAAPGTGVALLWGLTLLASTMRRRGGRN